MKRILFFLVVLSMLSLHSLSAAERQSIKLLFYGNSFTGMHNIPLLVKQVVESGQPEVEVDWMAALHGGSRLEYQWESKGNQLYLQLPERSAAEVEAALASFEKAYAEVRKEKRAERDPNAPPYRQRIANYGTWLGWMKASGGTPQLDYVVLQAHRDERGELASPYAVYARKFADMAKKHGVQPILYLTEFHELNPQPLTEPVDPEPFMEKARYQAKLANELDALTVPVPLAVLKLLQKRPDLTLRYSDNAHLNQLCAYLTACCFYAAIVDESPVGLSVRGINNPGFKNGVDPDGNPKNVIFPEELATVLQETAWEAVQEMKVLREQVASDTQP